MAKKYLALGIDDKELDVSFGKHIDMNNLNKVTQSVLMVFHGKDETVATFDRDFAAKIYSEAEQMVPEGLAIDLNSVMFALQRVFYQDNSSPTAADATRYLLGANFGAEINLSNLPLVGKAFPKDQNVGIESFQALFSKGNTDGWSQTAVDMLREINPTASVNLPLTIDDGFGIYIPINIGGQSQGFDLPTTTPPSTTGAPPSEPGTKWLLVNKKIGPITIRRVGGRYIREGEDEREYPRVDFLLDAQMKMGPLTFAMAGLSVGTPVGKFEPSFGLDGLGLKFDKGPVKISGTLLRDSADNSYQGLASVKIKLFGLSILGAYKDLNGQPSVFAYIVLDYPLGGDPCYFVTGLALGFGYNRTIKVPDAAEAIYFPLVMAAMEPTADMEPLPGTKKLEPDPFLILRRIKKDIPAQRGAIFLAFGVKATTYKMIESFSLLILRLGSRVGVDLVGIAKLSVPALVPYPLAQVELVLKASIDLGLDAITIKITGALTPASYIISRQCRLTGGFAFCAWLGGKYGGDFVYSMGGYHPNFKVPAHYPKVPRLGFHWQVSDKLTLKGGIYWALTPSAVMAGVSLQAVWSSGSIRAWFVAEADFIISWQPYYYSANIYLNFGVMARVKVAFVQVSMSFNVGARLKIWGPEFGGTAHIDLSVISFDVNFGRRASRPSALIWKDFRNSFLPADDNICSVTVAEGLTRETEDAATNDKISVINPADLVLTVNSVIPAKEADLSGNGFADWTGVMLGNIEDDTKEAELKQALEVNLDKFNNRRESFGIASMNVSGVSDSRHIITITGFDHEGSATDVTDEFIYEPVLKNVPEGLWGSSFDADLNGKMIGDMLTGFKITPKPKDKPDQTEDKLLSDFSYDEELKDNAYDWTDPLSFQLDEGSGGDTVEEKDEARRAEIQNIDNETLKAERDDILASLGLSLDEVDLSGLTAETADAFLAAPEVASVAA